MPQKGSLTVVGLGIQFTNHMTAIARTTVEKADKVLALTGDPVSITWIRGLNSATESLDACYEQGKSRQLIYEAMVERIMSCVREGLDVCVVSYGHPGFLVHATHESMRQARAEGYRTEMHPGISSLDCLFADLGIDPGDAGYQMYEATYFLLCKRRFDITCPLILLQIGVTGDLEHKRRYGREGLRALAAFLAKGYGPRHEVVIYEAAQYPFADPLIHRVPILALPKASVSTYSTLYVPPKRLPKFDAGMFRKLSLGHQNLRSG